MKMLFSSPRIVIVDDDNDQAMMMIDALSALKFPVVRFSGTGEDYMPKEPLSHVRLLILDLWLATSGFDAKHTAGVILKTVAPTVISGPCMVLVWTEHPTDVDQVKSALDHYNAPLDPERRVEPLTWIVLRKTDFVSNGIFHAEKLMRRVREELEKLDPADLLFEWESSCAEAASLAVDRILAFSYDRETPASGFEKWRRLLTTAIESLAQAWAGKRLRADGTPLEFKEALFSSLAYIHEDAIRYLLADSHIEEPAATSGDPVTMVAALNTLILTTRENSPVTPGAVSSMKGLSLEGMPYKADYGDNHRSFDKNYRRFISRIFLGNYSANKSIIYESCEPIMMEATPACDFAQNKRMRLRFAPGLLMPHDLKKKDLLPKGADYLKWYGPLIHNGNVNWLVLDSFHFFTLPTDAELPPPLFRLRSHVQSDIRSWLAGHMSRPGHISMDLENISSE